MRKLITAVFLTSALGLSVLPAATAAPVSGFEGLYTAVFTNCTIPLGTLETCEAAINAYAAALSAAVELEVANQSFTELRAEVFAANVADEPFQSDVDALFELLLPNSGALGPVVSPVG